MSLVPAFGARTPARLPRDIERRVDTAHGTAVVGAARVNAAAYVTHAALQFTASLTAEESRLIEQVPLGEGRFKALVDNFTGVACAEIAGMGWPS
jgi:O-acetyl-ADP-ribose deacetylase (regulator of RNase III)